MAAVFRPSGGGPFPLVVYFHEATGLTRSQIAIGPALSSSGFLVVMGCLTATDAVVVCGKPPADPYSELMDLGMAVPGAKQGPIGLIGTSMGADAAVSVGARRSDVGAIVADSGPSPRDFPRAPTLLLASKLDRPAIVDAVRTYETVLRARGTTVEAKYYDGGGHIVLVRPDTRDDAVASSVAFLGRYLRP